MAIPEALKSAMDRGDAVALEEQLHELGVLSERQLDEAFCYALRNGSADVVGTLMQHGAELKPWGMSQIELEKRGDLAIYEKILENGWDIDSNELGFPWITSGIWDDERLLRWVLERGADPNTPNRRMPNSAYNETKTPLAYAAEAPETFGLEILLAYGAEMDNEALFRAIAARTHPEKDHTVHMKILLDHGADVNHLSSRWGTPLQYAVLAGRKDMVRYLLERGADPTISTAWGTPAEHALKKGRKDIHEIIVEYLAP